MEAALARLCALGATAVAVVAGAAAGATSADALTPAADATVATVIVTVSAGSGSVGLVPGAVPVTFSGGCLGPYVATSTFSASGLLAGASCANVGSTTSGTYAFVSCTTGILSGSAGFTEPSGDGVEIRHFLAIFVAGAGIMVATPEGTTGWYVDDGMIGSLVGAGVMTALDSTTCGPPGATIFGLTMALAAEYGTGV